MPHADLPVLQKVLEGSDLLVKYQKVRNDD